MKTSIITAQIVDILKECKNECIADYSLVLFDPQLSFQACDLTYLIIELCKRNNLDVRELVLHIKKYSVNGIAQAVNVVSSKNENCSH